MEIDGDADVKADADKGGGEMDIEEEGEGEGKKEVEANLGEFLTMLAGGLAGASSTMVSATITAISRIVFEFKGTSLPLLLFERQQKSLCLTRNHCLRRNPSRDSYGYLPYPSHIPNFRQPGDNQADPRGCKTLHSYPATIFHPSSPRSSRSVLASLVK